MQLHLDPGPDAARTARCAVREQLQDHMSAQNVVDIELLVSELVTNGVRHGNGEIDLEVLLDSKHAQVRCSDHGPGFEPGTPQPHTDTVGGYGLVLVDALSDRWGVDNEDHSCVWFELTTA